MTRTFSLLFLAMLGLFLTPARAVVDDAHSAAMEAADSQVKKGFKVREEYWSGNTKSGEKKAVKAQLYKGNEYWFWLGCDVDEVEISIEIYDAKGQKVSAETTSITAAGGVRVVPAKSGAFTVVFSIKHKKDDKAKLHWALAYGYR